MATADHREAVEAARRLAKHYDAYMADDESELADDYPDIARELGGIVARALLSLSDRVEEARKWQPINTAPRDGTKILWLGEDIAPLSYCVIHWPEYEACFGQGWWQPLPSPPLSSLLLEG
jgi:hypothetical protein